MDAEPDRNGLSARDPETERVGRAVLDAAFEVHSELGPGLLESVYSSCLGVALQESNIRVAREVRLPIRFRGRELPGALRIDLVAADRVIVEVKAVEALHRVHGAQLLTYLKLSGLTLGYLLNFNAPRLKNGIARVILDADRPYRASRPSSSKDAAP